MFDPLITWLQILVPNTFYPNPIFHFAKCVFISDVSKMTNLNEVLCIKENCIYIIRTSIFTRNQFPREVAPLYNKWARSLIGTKREQMTRTDKATRTYPKGGAFLVSHFLFVFWTWSPGIFGSPRRLFVGRVRSDISCTDRSNWLPNKEIRSKTHSIPPETNKQAWNLGHQERKETTWRQYQYQEPQRTNDRGLAIDRNTRLATKKQTSRRHSQMD